jgi:hypothetical protein
MHYNFCRVHKTLRVTPVMEAGIADHIWTIEEMLVKVGAKCEKARFVVGPSETLARQSKSSAGVCPMQVATKCITGMIREPLPEECVTFQVALIASDGLVVASDRRMVHSSPAPDDNPAYEQRDSPKFHENGALICFYAGQDTADRAARVIATNCQPIPGQSEFEWENALDIAARSIAAPQFAPSDRLFVVRKDVFNHIWVIFRNPDNVLPARKVSDRTCIGDNSTARFLAYQLWRPNATISELRNLAVLTLSYASLSNPTSVGPPFDVLTIEKGGNLRWSSHDMPNNFYSEFDRRLKKLFVDLCNSDTENS